MNQTVLSLKNIEKSFDGTRVLCDLSLDIERGEFVTLLGPSGCGKTTTLRITAGLTAPDRGHVFLNGHDVTALPPEKRPVNTVFQNYALFPHMTVEKNIGYGLRLTHMPRAQIKQKVDEMLNLVKLPGYGQRMPSQLSGGQRQRVAIARAVALSPNVLLLDEPLGALDLQLRGQMQEELKQIQKELGITFVYITHDQEEALNMSDRIAVMNRGRIEQIGTPEQIYERPETRFVAGFIGEATLLEGSITAVDKTSVTVKTAQGHVLCAHRENARVGDHAAVSVHAERIRFSPHAQPGFDLRAVVKSHRYAGSVLRTELTLNCGQTIRAASLEAIKLLPAPGEQVYLYWKPEGAALILGEAGA